MRLGVPSSIAETSAAASRVAVAAAANHARSALAALLLIGSTAVVTPPASALDGAAIGACLFRNCPAPLARCVTDPTCAANLLCIQTCTGKPDEGECQIKCGDEFSNDVVGEFTTCAVSQKQCVPQRQDDGTYPVPKSSALAKKFSPEVLEGDWYISAGLNPAFDLFDCQLHKFNVPASNKLVGNLQWRIKDPIAGTNFVTRYTVQEFVQDPEESAIMYNHDNEFLHYQDDWYILAFKEKEYVLVYYRGSNDAWDGYGGAVVYTTSPKLDPKYFPELDAALRPVGLRWDQFRTTDNSCKARETKLEEFEADFVLVETRVASGIQTAEKQVVQELVKDVNAVESELVKDVTAVEREIVKDAKAVESEVERDFTSLLRRR